MRAARDAVVALTAPALIAALFAAWAAPGPASAQTSDLVSETAFRVCADPANMPFSNEAGEGLENKLADLFAGELGLPVDYTWFPQATGFIRRTLRENRCDVIMGYSQGHELVLNTNHYYTSSYVLVTRSDGPLAAVEALSDPLLKGKRLGVVAGSPPATHLARNGLIGKARPYHLMVDRRHESPAEMMLADLEAGEIDGALLWGPIGGYFAKRYDGAVTVTPLLRETAFPPMFFRITMGVRQGELEWKRKLNSMIRKLQPQIDAILTEFGAPLLDEQGEAVINAAKGE